MGTRMELLELALHLKQERLFINSERQYLQTLNEKVLKTVEKLYHVAWIAREQRINLDGLILSKPDCSPAICCERANNLESVNFVDAYKQLGFQESLYGDFLRQLRSNPKLVAMCLVSTEKLKTDLMHHIVNVMMASVYGHCILQEDENYVLQLLRHLMELQLATSENPRRLLRHGSCAFSRVYKNFNEGLFSTKLFLTAALHEPIMQLLMEDELFLDIDPSKAVIRFPPQERFRRFGKEGTQEYVANLQRYRNWTITKLVNLTYRFISGIKGNMFCFPPNLVWLVKQVYNIVMKAKKVEVREVGAMCIDLIFYFFICPAIVNPEPYGIISDTPISYIARFNLMQVAQILHVLAMSKWEEIEPKLMDIYCRFDKECMSSLLDVILEGSVEDEPPDFGSRLQHLSRSAILVSEYDLMTLISTLRTICNDGTNEELDKKSLELLLAELPASPPSGGQNATSSDSVNNDVSPQTPGAKRNLLGKGKNKNKRLVPGIQEQNEDKQKTDAEEVNSTPSSIEDVLVILLNNPLNDCPGMLSEQKVLLNMEQQSRHSKVRLKLENLNIEDGTQEKRTRFSLSHDQDSIGTSDNLEAISEAASNHSVSSSLELENENDNLSDMVSANVSGRGTPNVSGRDTPSSQTEGEGSEERPLNLPTITPKQNQEDIDDRFGKFDIRPLIEGDETISLVSDTWSTDVLASDSEMMGEPQVERPLDDITIPNTAYIDPHQPLFGLSHLNALDMVDTASEAWSTDVLASDSERMQEVDTDDTGSVARSDDAASVTRSDDATSVARSDDIVRYENDLDHQMDGAVSLSLTDHCTDENITPRASGSRSPIDGAPSKQNNCSVVNSHGISPKSKGHIVGTEGAIESLGILTAKIQTDLIHQDLHNIDESCDESIRFRQKRFPNDMDEVDSDVPNDAGDGFASLKTRYPKQDNETQIMNEAWNSGESHDPNDMKGMQTLGRLSIAMGELPDNGILPSDSSVFAAAAAHTTDNLPAKEQLSPMRVAKDGFENEGRREEKKVDFLEERRARPDEKEVFSGVRLSTGSITSSVSSSSSGSGPGDATVKSDLSASHDASVNLTVSGTIPKSISFDKTAEKGDKEMESEDHKQKKGFFKNLKGFVKGRARKSSRGHDELGIPVRNYDRASASDVFRDDGSLAPNHRHLRRTVSEDPKSDIEEILAKYRKKPSSLMEGDAAISTCSDSATNTSDKDKESVHSEDDRQIAGSTSSEASYAFLDAKRKLRLVLSSADVSAALWGENNPFLLHYQDNDKQLGNEIVSFLKMQLAEAVNLQDKSLVAQLHETLRCICLLDKESSQKLFRSLREDYKKRAPYISYLVRSRQGLLTTLALLERILDRIERDKITCSKFMISVCVRFFLEKRERIIQHFVDEFQRLTVSDEKTDLVEQFLQHLYKDMETDAVWQAASEQQMEQAQIAIERNIMSQLYIYALYPNGDGDVMRDKLIFEHIQKLSKVIMPNHRYLRIPKIYQYECPWPAAQAEVGTINAYKTPRDKLHCVLRCCNTIMNLLRLANEKVIPAADDFMPVLVYVLVQANPLNLLSNIQYVNSFYQKRIEGEDEYWWTQFCSAVEFIKTMDYNN